MIYLDNAATTMKKPKCVIDAVVAAMEHMGNAGRGANEASLDASRIIYDTREKISDLVNLNNPSQVSFTCNSTESLNTAIKGTLTQKIHHYRLINFHICSSLILIFYQAPYFS